MGFHIPPFTSVPHLHLHVLSPASKMSMKSQLRYGPQSHWFITVSDAFILELFLRFYSRINMVSSDDNSCFLLCLQVNKVLSQLKTSGKVK